MKICAYWLVISAIFVCVLYSIFKPMKYSYIHQVMFPGLSKCLKRDNTNQMNRSTCYTLSTDIYAFNLEWMCLWKYRNNSKLCITCTRSVVRGRSFYLENMGYQVVSLKKSISVIHLQDSPSNLSTISASNSMWFPNMGSYNSLITRVNPE